VEIKTVIFPSIIKTKHGETKVTYIVLIQECASDGRILS